MGAGTLSCPHLQTPYVCHTASTRAEPILVFSMRLAVLAILALALALALSASTAAGAGRVPGGSLEIKDGRGIVQIKGQGALLGLLESGSLQITDLTPGDQWSPRVNGVPRGKVVWIRGTNVRFYVPGGRYKIVARGDGISVSAFGPGQAVLKGEPDAVGDTGTYTVGDAPAEPVPSDVIHLPFGPSDAPSAGSAKIRS